MKTASQLLLFLLVVFVESAPSWAQPRTDHVGDPLPAGATVRLGTIRLRQAQGVNGVAFTPDGKFLVSCGWQGPIRMWDVATGRQVGSFVTNEGSGAFAVAFTSDGARMASVSENGFVRLWDANRRELLWSVKGHSGRTYGVAFSPDDAVFATAGGDTSVRLWDAATGALLLELTNSERSGGDVRPVVFSPDGRLLASATNQGTILIWNLEKGGEPISIPGAHQRGLSSLVFSADGKQLVSSGYRLQRTGPRTSRSIGDIRLWNTADGGPEQVWDAGEELAGGGELAVSRDGSVIVSSHQEKFIVWDPTARRPQRIIPAPGLSGAGRTHGMAISPDNRLLAAASRDSRNKVYLWDITTGEAVLPQEESHKEGVLAVDFSPDGKWIATASADHTTRLWNAATGEHVRKIEEGTGWARYVEFFPDGERVAIGHETRVVGGTPGFQGEMKICRVSDGQVLHHFLTPDRVMCGAISSDGGRVAAGIGLDGPFGLGDEAGQIKIIVWDAELGGVVAEGTGPKSQFQQVAFANTADELWSVNERDGLRKWNVQTGREIENFSFQEGSSFTRAMYSPISDRVVFGILDSMPGGRSRGRLRVRSRTEPATLWEKSFPDGWPSVVTLSRDGRVVAANLQALSGSGASERVVLWSMENGDELLSFDVGDDPIRSLAFSPDGKRLASGMELGDTLVWDVSATQPKPSR